ncbi:MAG: nuclear transport factor 2 family protein [Clostridiales bacterium]|nr:nuclear transport factor 2 family protein [Clostridiales bacterium]
MNTEDIKEIIQFYFDGSYEGSSEKMDKAFHQAAHIYGCAADGSLTDWPRDAFVSRVGARPADAPSYPREDEILSIDFTGENTAVAKVKLRVGNTRFTDVLCLMRLESKWGIIAKMLSGVPVE